VDDSGNVYVTGSSMDTTAYPDYATIKYNSSGDTVWVRRYDGPDNDGDNAYAIAVDKNGNVYVTGRSVGIGTDYDYATIKYNSSGGTVWVRRYDSGGGTGYKTDEASAIAVDDSGNVYVTGRSFGYGTIKYNSSGDSMWVRSYIGIGSGAVPHAYAITVDNNGNVYVTGASSNGIDALDYATIKYNSVGDTVWVRRYSGTAKSYKEPKGYDFDKTKGFARGGGAAAIAVDNNENVYVTGAISESDSFNYGTIKYNSYGNIIWDKKYCTGRWAEATALALDSSGNVYVTGKEGYTVGDTSVDCVTIKYNSLGDTVWIRKYEGQGYNDCGTGIAVDTNGNAYVTGYSGGATSWDYATIKYSSSGSEEWVQRYNGPGSGDDRAYAIAVDNKGYVYVTGSSAGSSFDYDYTTIKYSTVGIEEPLTLDFGLGIWELKAFPNPFVKNTELRVKGSALKDNKIQIYDLGGRLVKTTHSNIIGNDLKKGIYFVKVNNYKPIKVVKMSYVK
ncbi:MAG: SBBP repeat-containing protein, partial [bacterium]